MLSKKNYFSRVCFSFSVIFLSSLSLLGCVNTKKNLAPENSSSDYIVEIWNKDAAGKVSHQSFPLYKFRDHYEYCDTSFVYSPAAEKGKKGEVIYEKEEIGHRFILTPVEDAANVPNVFDIELYFGESPGAEKISSNSKKLSPTENNGVMLMATNQQVSSRMQLDASSVKNFSAQNSDTGFNWPDFPKSEQRVFVGGTTSFSTGEAFAFAIFLPKKSTK